jgi:hypothetical protein
LALLAWPVLVLAQTDDPPKKETPAPPAAGTKVPVVPGAAGADLDSLYFRDSKGNLVLVPGMTFEKLEKLLKLEQGLAPAQAPAYVLDGLSITGSVQNQLATLEVATIRVRDEGWVRMPLKMNKVSQQIPKYTGPASSSPRSMRRKDISAG